VTFKGNVLSSSLAGIKSRSASATVLKGRHFPVFNEELGDDLAALAVDRLELHRFKLAVDAVQVRRG
jgi:hypothetical protein